MYMYICGSVFTPLITLISCSYCCLELCFLQLKEKQDKLKASAAKKKEAFVAGRTHGVTSFDRCTNLMT